MFLAIAAFVFCEYYALKTGVPTVASFPMARRVMVDLLQAEFADFPHGQRPTIIDLGSGGGQLCAQIARALPQARVIGIEISYLPWLRSVMTQHLFGPANLSFQRVDFWGYSCRPVDAVVTFLTGNIMDRVSTKLRRELRPGSLVIANDEQLTGDWQAFATRPSGLVNGQIYAYRQSA